MSASEWIGVGIIAVVIIGGLLLLNQITKPYDVKTEAEFQKRKQMGARTAVPMVNATCSGHCAPVGASRCTHPSPIAGVSPRTRATSKGIIIR